jgi:hypothetical protein
MTDTLHTQLADILVHVHLNIKEADPNSYYSLCSSHQNDKDPEPID